MLVPHLLGWMMKEDNRDTGLTGQILRNVLLVVAERRQQRQMTD